MPMYEYECQACGHRQEDMRKYEDRKSCETPCEACGWKYTNYVVSATKAQTFRFKNDSRNKGQNIKEL